MSEREIYIIKQARSMIKKEIYSELKTIFSQMTSNDDVLYFNAYQILKMIECLLDNLSDKE